MNIFALLQIIIPFLLAVAAALFKRQSLKVSFLTASILIMLIFRILALKWCNNHIEIENKINFCSLSPLFGVLFLLSTFFIVIIFNKLKKISEERL